MPESPIRVYLPEKRPADVRPRQPHWFSAEVSAAVLTQLQNIGPTANWNEAINAIALAATGRYAPVIGDIVTLHRGTDSFRREWNGFRWIYIEPYLDGDNIYIESLLANTLSGDIDADRIRAKNVTTPLLLANSFEGGKWESNALFADHVRTDRTIIDESVQVGLGTISFDNLSPEIRAPVSVSAFSSVELISRLAIPPETPNFNPGSLLEFAEDLTFTRNAANESIIIHIHPRYSYRGYTYRYFGSDSHTVIRSAPHVNVRVSVGRSEGVRTGIANLVFSHTFPQAITGSVQGTYEYAARSVSVPLAASPIGSQRFVFIEALARTWQGYRTSYWWEGFRTGEPRQSVNITAILQEARPFG